MQDEAFVGEAKFESVQAEITLLGKRSSEILERFGAE
jgi:hypothetical protein